MYETAFLAVISALNMQKDDNLFNDETKNFRDMLRNTRFLFGADAYDYLDALLRHLIRYRYIYRKTNDPNDPSSTPQLENEFEGKTQFLDESLQRLPKELGPYLRIDERLTSSQMPISKNDV